MHPSKNSYLLLLGRPWLRAASTKIDWDGKKPHIIYSPSENLTKNFIQFQGLLLIKTSSHSLEDEILNPQPQNELKEKKVRFANLGRKELVYSTIVQTIPLSCMGLGLYDWKDDGKFTQWLRTHPTSSRDEVVSINFIDSFAT